MFSRYYVSMKHKLINKKFIYRSLIIIYMISSLSALAFVGEKSYRSTLINYGYKIGNDAMVETIINNLYENPCGEITIQNEGKVINLIESKCMKSPPS